MDTSTMCERRKFKLKRKNDGTILKIHHTIKTDKQEIKRIKICQICFNDFNTVMLAVDSRDNVIIFDLESVEFWTLQVKIPECSRIQFLQNHKTWVIAGTKKGFLIILDISGIGAIMKTLSIFKSTIISISFCDTANVLVSTKTEATILDLMAFVRKHNLDSGTDSNFIIKQIGFIPNSSQIYGSFSDDKIHIWMDGSFKLVKHIYPLKAREKKLKTGLITVNLRSDNWNLNSDLYMESLTRDYSDGVLSFVAFSDDGQRMCISTKDEYLILYSTSTWEVFKIVRTVNMVIKWMQFSPINLDGANLLAMLSSTGDSVVLDIDDTNLKAVIRQQAATKVCISRNYNIIALILTTGEAILLSLNYILNTMKLNQLALEEMSKQKLVRSENDLKEFDKQVRKTITKDRLIPVLKEYGEYPTKYRPLIWQSLLELPRNCEQFKELLDRDMHPCTKHFDQLYPLKDISLLRNLKRLVSCLAHWTPVFGECPFIANFIFPFLKLFESNLLLCFEIVATILINQCQLWFEFTPMEPINYLGMIENILAHFEPNLINFYKSKEITTKVYAWALAQSAFTEVLDEKQWMQVWDNVISHSSYFLIFCIIGYNILLKPAIMRLESRAEIERFFDVHSHIDVPKLIIKAHDLIASCPSSLHPQKYMIGFEPLCKNFYQQFLKYPKALVTAKSNIDNLLQSENKILNKKLFELEKIESLLNDRSSKQLAEEEHSKRLKEVEKKYQNALLHEQERIAYQRKQVLLYKKYLRNREAQLIENARENAITDNILRKENELDSLLIDLERKKRGENADLLFADEDFKMKELAIMAKKLDLQTKRKNESLRTKFSQEFLQLEQEQARFDSEIKNQPRQEVVVNPKIKVIEDAILETQKDFFRILNK